MTTKLPPEAYQKLWQTASEQELGIMIKCDPKDQAQLVKAIYESKGFGAYENLILMQPQPPGTIYLMKKTVEMPG